MPRVARSAFAQCASISLLITVVALTQSSGKANTNNASSLEMRHEWRERVEVRGRPLLVTGRHWVDLQNGQEITSYFDSRGKALPLFNPQTRPKTWLNRSPQEAPARVRADHPTLTKPLPATLACSLPLSSITSRLPTPGESEFLLGMGTHSVPGKTGRPIGLRRSLPKPLLAQDDDAAEGWHWLPDGGRVWTAQISSKQALALRVHFTQVNLPAGARISLFLPEDLATADGPHDRNLLGSARQFWSGTVFSDHVAIECAVPAGIPRGGTLFRIAEITHRYVDVLADLSQNTKLGPCHNDVTCFPSWGTVASAVSGIGVVSKVGELMCTGTLLADTDPQSTNNLYLTANHCIANQAEADSAEFYWFYQTSVCDGVAPSPASVPRTTGGADLLATMTKEQGNDFCLLHLRRDAEIPNGVTYAGWSTATPAPNDPLTVIHHPDGSHKRISFGHAAGGSENYLDVLYDSGSTEPGSSGSALLNSEQKIIGQLWGGDAACNLMASTDQYGRFAVAYPIIERWLAGQSVVPANDDYAQADPLAGESGEVHTSNSGATLQPGEPVHASVPGGKSIWFRWTCPTSTNCVFNTDGSGFDTILAIYIIPEAGVFQWVAANDDATDFAPASQVEFQATAGTQYFVAVDGYRGAAGPITLNWHPIFTNGGDNDAFAGARPLGGSGGVLATSNTEATAEPGETSHAGAPANKSIWFRWTAPRDGLVSFDTEGTEFGVNTVLGIYQGNAVNTLSLVAENDDIDAVHQIFTSRVTFTAQAGASYLVAVDGYDDLAQDLYDSGTIVLNWRQPTPGAVAPPNDKFANAALLSGASGTAYGNSEQATTEPAEPAIESNAGGASVWHRWVAPASGLATFTTAGTSFDSLLAVYRGTNITTLALLGSGDDTSADDLTSLVTVPVTAGTEYRIAVDGFNTDSGVTRMGDYSLEWSLCANCGGNDQFANAEVLAGSAGRIYGTTVGATREAADPSLAGNLGGKTIWYRWTAPVNGTVTIHTFGSTFDTLLGAFTGSQLNALHQIASNDDAGSDVQSQVSFEAVAGTEYRIIVAGYRNSATDIESGSVVLTWSQPAGITVGLSNPRLESGGEFTFTFNGLPGKSYDLLTSADAQTWTKFTTVTVPNGSTTVRDPSPVRDARYYQARQLP